MKCSRLNTLLASAAMLACPLAGFAQTDLERFERQLEQIHRDNQRAIDDAISPLQRTTLDFGGWYTISFMAIDDAAQKTHQLVQHDLGGYARLNFEDVHEFFVRGVLTYRDFKTGDAFDRHGDDLIGPKLERATYRFDLQRAMSVYGDKDIKGNVVFQGGRQLVHWANGLTLSQDIDGAVVQLSYYPFSVELLGGLLRDSVTDLDPYRTNFTDDSRRSFFGAMVSAQINPRHTVFAYGLLQDDNNNDPVREDIINGDGVTTRFGYDSHYIGIGARGNLTDRLLYSVEGVYQGGKTYSSGFLGNPNEGPITVVDPTRDEIHAWALDARLDYYFSDENQTRLTAELVVASGDGDRSYHGTSSYGGNKPGTSDRGFNGFGMTNTGLAFAPSVSNLVLIRGGISTTPFPNVSFVRNLQVGSDLLVFNKLVSGGPINENTADSTYLGTEADFYANWRITSDLALSMRYGVFLPGRALSHAPGGYGSDPRHFFYSGLTLSF